MIRRFSIDDFGNGIPDDNGEYVLYSDIAQSGDHAELKRLAESALEYPWYIQDELYISGGARMHKQDAEFVSRISPDVALKLIAEIEVIRAALASQPVDALPQAEPFMYAIQNPDGSAFIDEHCVAKHQADLEADVGCNVVPVFLLPVSAQQVMSDEEIMIAAEQYNATMDAGCIVAMTRKNFNLFARSLLSSTCSTLQALRENILAVPKRVEKLGGQNHSYIQLDEVIGWIDRALLHKVGVSQPASTIDNTLLAGQSQEINREMAPACDVIATDTQIKSHIDVARGCGQKPPLKEDIVAWLESTEGRAAMSAEIKKCNEGLDLVRESRKVTLEMLNTPMTDFSKRNNLLRPPVVQDARFDSPQHMSMKPASPQPAAPAQGNAELTDELCEMLSTVLHFILPDESQLSKDVGEMCHNARTYGVALQSPASVDVRKDAINDIAAERQRQQSVEGYDTEHDDEHPNGEIAAYAAYYAMPPAARDWPATETGYGDTFGEAIIPVDWEKPKEQDRRAELIKAGALIVAEIERLDRAAITTQQKKDKS